MIPKLQNSPPSTTTIHHHHPNKIQDSTNTPPSKRYENEIHVLSPLPCWSIALHLDWLVYHRLEAPTHWARVNHWHAVHTENQWMRICDEGMWEEIANWNNQIIHHVMDRPIPRTEQTEHRFYILHIDVIGIVPIALSLSCCTHKSKIRPHKYTHSVMRWRREQIPLWYNSPVIGPSEIDNIDTQRMAKSGWWDHPNVQYKTVSIPRYVYLLFEEMHCLLFLIPIHYHIFILDIDCKNSDNTSSW